MPEVPGAPPSPRTALFWDGDQWRYALVDNTGHLQIDVLSTAMDALAATAANQVLMNANLALIAEMRDALQSVATDRLIVRGEDQLFSISGVLSSPRTAVISGAGGYVDSNPVPANTYWVVTSVASRDATSPTTAHTYNTRHDGVAIGFATNIAAIAAGDWTYWNGWEIIDAEDTIRVYFAGGLVGDSCNVQITGYTMTLET